MRKRKSILLFVLPIAIFVATSIADTSRLSLRVEAQTEDEGGGSTRNLSKRGRADTTSAKPFLSLSKSEAESGSVAIDSPAEAASLVPIVACPLPGGLDHVAAGTGARNTGNGTIRIQGAPANSKVVTALLYWGLIVPDVPPFPSSDTVNFNGHLVGGKLVGNSEQPCWVGDLVGEFVAYKADVTRFIPAAINGDYQIDGLASSITDGSDPWPPTTICSPNPPLPLAEGATLVIIYSNASVPLGARVYIHENLVTFANQVDISHALNPVLPAHSLIKHTRIGADGNVGCSIFAQEQITDEKTFLGQSIATLFQIKGDIVGFLTPAINHDSDWNGEDGGPLNQLWDTNTSGFRPSINGIDPIPSGAASYLVRYQSRGDCIVAVAHVLSVQ